MASCTTSSWTSSSTSPRIKLTVTEYSTSATSVKYKLVLQYIAASAASTNTARSYTVKMDGATVASGTYSINGKSGTSTIGTWYKIINKGTSSRSISFSCSMAFNLKWSGTYCGTRSASGSITITKKTSYTVSYNANGGSGAPSSQTKWHGTNLTLSSIKPTRSGWTFMGWGTSETDTSVDYSAGASYTANAGDTLYAIWRKSLTLTYNANGGSGAPSAASAYIYNSTSSKAFTIVSTPTSLVKSGYTFMGWGTSSSDTSANYSAGGSVTISANTTIYAIWRKTIKLTYNANGGSGAPAAVSQNVYNATTSYTFTLSGTPTRTNYNFLGWSTSASATTPSYKTGGTISLSSSKTLYAVWELAYTKPRIINATASRCIYDSTTGVATKDDGGTFLLVNFEWECDREISSIIIESSITTASPYVVPNLSGTEGIVSNIVLGTDTIDTEGNGPYSTEMPYICYITVEDNNGYSEESVKIPAMAYMLDFKYGGKGVSVGKPAELEGYFDSNWNSRFRENVYIGEKTGNLDGNQGIFMHKYGYIQLQRMSDGNHPYIGFMVGNATSLDGCIRVNASNGYMQFVSSDAYQFDAKPVYFANGTTYYVNGSGNAKFNTLTAAGATSLGGKLDVTGNTTLTGWLKPNNGVYLPNAKYIYFYNTSGNSVQVMTLNTSNNLVIGHGGYTNSVGSTNIYGNDIQLISKGDITTSGVLTIGNGSGTGGLINSQVNLGTSNASDGNRYYLNGNGTGRFNALRYASSQAISSRRYKNNIDYKDAEFWHDSLMQIKPCTFYYKNDNETKHIGLIAEDLYELIPDLVDTDDEGKPASIEYANLTIPLIGEVQRLNNVVDEQKEEIDSLKEENKQIKQEMQQLKELVAKLVS